VIDKLLILPTREFVQLLTRILSLRDCSSDSGPRLFCIEINPKRGMASRLIQRLIFHPARTIGVS
jgi:hypothetical protein